MKTCNGCRYFVGDETFAQCFVEPPRKSSEKGGSYRPNVRPTDNACQHFRQPMPVVSKIEGDATMKLEIKADPAITRILNSLPLAERTRLDVCGPQANGGLGKTSFEVTDRISPVQEKPKHSPRLFCYAPQSAVVRDFMREVGWDAKVNVLAGAEHAKGICGGVFISVVGHSHGIPEELFHVIKANGFIVWTASDKFLRDKADRLTGKF